MLGELWVILPTEDSKVFLSGGGKVRVELGGGREGQRENWDQEGSGDGGSYC